MSIIENCETLFYQFHRNAEETLKFKPTKLGETFPFKPSVILDLNSNWMIGLTNFEVDNSIYNISEKNRNLEIQTVSSDIEISIVELKDEVAEMLGL